MWNSTLGAGYRCAYIYICIYTSIYIYIYIDVYIHIYIYDTCSQSPAWSSTLLEEPTNHLDGEHQSLVLQIDGAEHLRTDIGALYRLRCSKTDVLNSVLRARWASSH